MAGKSTRFGTSLNAILPPENKNPRPQPGTRINFTRGTTLFPAFNRFSSAKPGAQADTPHSNLVNIRARLTIGEIGALTHGEYFIPLSVCSSGRIFRSPDCPGSHSSQVRCQIQKNVLVSIIAF
jgi:hypothetical protein